MVESWWGKVVLSNVLLRRSDAAVIYCKVMFCSGDGGVMWSEVIQRRSGVD
jgi:hypothetical protein